MQSPYVTVVMPFLDAAQTIERATKSVLAQTMKNIELVAVDDGSTDESVARLRRTWGVRDGLVSLETSRIGPAKARNLGLKHATGKFVQFLDADDEMLPRKLERQTSEMERSSADVALCDFRIIRGNTVVQTRHVPQDISGKDWFVVLCNLNAVGDRAIANTVTPLHRRATLLRLGGFHEELRWAEDKDLLLRLACANARFTLVPEVLMSVFDDPGPRVSLEKRPAGVAARTLLELARCLRQPPYELTAPRRSALGLRLAESACFAYQEGQVALAKASFEAARALSPGVIHGSGRGYRIVAKLFGQLTAERLRHLRGRLRR